MLGRGMMGNAMSATPLQPFRAPSPLLQRGKLIGLDKVQRQVFLDPWRMQANRIIGSMIILLIGAKNMGKSTLAKSIVALLMTMQAQFGQTMRVRINDRKPNNGRPEWEQLALKLGCKAIRLSDLRLNIFDPIMIRDKMSLLGLAEKVLTLIVGHAHGRNLSVYENLALMIAVDKIWNSKLRLLVSPLMLMETLRKLNRTDYNAYFRRKTNKIYVDFADVLKRDPEAKKELDALIARKEVTTDFDAFFKGAGLLSAALMDVIDGKYGEVFSGSQSMYDILTMDALVLDWTGIEDFAQVLLQTILFSFETAAMIAGMDQVIPHILISEEEHEGMLVVSWLEAKASRNAKARALPTVDISTTQFTNGLRVGDKDSYVREVADRIYRGTDLLIAGPLPHDEGTINDLMEWGYSRKMANEITTSYNYGTFAAKPRDPAYKAFKFQHILTPSVKAIAGTNDATENMLIDRMPCLDNPKVLEGLKMLDIDPRVLTAGVPL